MAKSQALDALASSPMPLVSVVVASYTMDRFKDLKDVLKSLQAQTYPRTEILLVVEKSLELSERVEEFASEEGLNSLQVYYNDSSKGLGSNRNYGIQRAKGEIIAFIDDDAVAFPDWIEGIVRTFSEDEGAIGVTGSAFPLWEEPSMGWFPDEFFWILSCPTPAWIGDERRRPVRNVWGVNMAFRREAFSALSFAEGFGWNARGASDSPTGLAGDDTMFSLDVTRATHRPILYDPGIRVHHKVYKYRIKREFVRRRAFWEGYTKGTLTKPAQSFDGFELSTEYKLLRRILFHFFPRTLGQLITQPVPAWRRLDLGVRAMFYVVLGYSAAKIPWPGRALARRFAT